MKKVLPVKYPPITSFPYLANMLSILWVNQERTLPWISDHFIQIYGSTNLGFDFYDNSSAFYIPAESYCPFIHIQQIDRKVINHGLHIFSDYVEFLIDNDWYSCLCLDRYYLSCSAQYKKDHFLHSTFIYGYDKEKEVVLIADFFNNGEIYSSGNKI